MKTPLLALCLLASFVPLGCSSEDPPPDPLANRSGFCQAWAESACQAPVLDRCNAPSKEDCVDTQSDVCLDLVPENYSSKHASACLGAVKEAYKDAELTAEEIDIVTRLGAPCDQLSTGVVDEGDSCEKNDDCNTADGLTCIIKGGETSGSCEKPEQVGGGEPCDEAQQVCGENNYCNGENCVAFKKTGAACTGDFQCRPSDRCVLAAEDASETTCEARLESAEPCSAHSDCQSLYCAMDGTTGLCAELLVLTLREPLCEDLR